MIVFARFRKRIGTNSYSMATFHIMLKLKMKMKM